MAADGAASAAVIVATVRGDSAESCGGFRNFADVTAFAAGREAVMAAFKASMSAPTASAAVVQLCPPSRPPLLRLPCTLYKFC